MGDDNKEWKTSDESLSTSDCDDKLMKEWKEKLVPDRSGLYSVYLPMQKDFRTQVSFTNLMCF